MSKYIGTPVVNISADTVDVTGDITTTDATPEVIIVNNTHEDTDGGREGKLTFKGQASGGEETTLAQIQASHDGTADDEKGDLIFKTNDGSDGASPTEVMRIDSDGDVGIGTNDPEARLSFGSFIPSNGQTIHTYHSGTTRSGFGIVSGQHRMFTSTSATLGFGHVSTTDGSTFTERMRIDADGNVGIGATPTVKFHVVHTSGGNVAAFTDNSSADLIVNLTGGVSRISPSTGTLALGTSSTERMRITSDGKLLIGKTSDAAAGTGLIFGPANVGAYSTIASGNTWHVHDTSSYKFYVNSNGGIYNYQANDANLSDQREKKNIETLDDKWDVVKAWSLKKFHYNSEEDSDPKKIGVIAQDLETDNPELVSDFILTPSQEEIIDDDGNVTTEASDAVTRKSVKEQQMMWMAIKALQEAMTRIETLETKVAALEGE